MILLADDNDIEVLIFEGRKSDAGFSETGIGTGSARQTTHGPIIEQAR
jgi:hypothetical protein